MLTIPKSFFERSSVIVAKELIGKQIIRNLPDGSKLAMIITETEAYGGEEDLASHARFGRTERNSIMYADAGVWYVYLIYGIHEMLNVVTGTVNKPGAVLIRAGVFNNKKIAKGPGVVTREFGITRELYGKSAIRNSPLVIRDSRLKILKKLIVSGPRVGVDYAGKWKDKPWRFVLDPKELFKMN